MSEVSFDVSECDAKIIDLIIDRLEKESSQDLKENFSRLQWAMDVTACHANGCALDLAKLLAADFYEFMHDMRGISQNIDRKTGKLNDCFLPRSALDAESIEFMRVNNDINGNPRYVCHFLNLNTLSELNDREGILDKYRLAVNRSKTIGGKAYRGKNYGGGIVFQTYSLPKLISNIAQATGRKFAYYREH